MIFTASSVNEWVLLLQNQVLGDQPTQYLSSSNTTTDCLSLYPAVKQAFVKANSTLPSLATVERLFSTAGRILCNVFFDKSNTVCGESMILYHYDKAAACHSVFTHTFTHSLTHSFTHSLTHSLIHSYIHSFIHSYIHSYI